MPASASSAARSPPRGQRTPRRPALSSLTPDAAFAALTEGRTVLDLAEGLQLRRVRVMGAHRIELSGFTETMRDRLRAYGLFSEIISWKLRLFVPTDASGAGVWRSCSTAIRSSASASGRPRDAATTPPNWRTVSRARPRRCAATISPTAGAKAATGWSATSATRRAAHVRPAQGTERKGAAGKWTDAATGEHGDLLDIIRESCGLVDFKDVADEARRFLSLPHPEPEPDRPRSRTPSAPTGSPEAARRLFAMSQPIARTLAETYLRNRGITALHGTAKPALPPALLLPA